jgi:hypothetical protein
MTYFQWKAVYNFISTDGIKKRRKIWICFQFGMILGDNFDKPDLFLELSMYINSIDGGVRGSRKFSYTFFSKDLVNNGFLYFKISRTFTRRWNDVVHCSPITCTSFHHLSSRIHRSSHHQTDRSIFKSRTWKFIIFILLSISQSYRLFIYSSYYTEKRKHHNQPDKVSLIIPNDR